MLLLYQIHKTLQLPIKNKLVKRYFEQLSLAAPLAGHVETGLVEPLL